MYRTVALAATRRGVDLSNADSLSDLARDIDIDVTAECVLLDGEDVTKAIRKGEITSVIHFVADNPEVRSHLVDLQRRIALAGDYVTEGRDRERSRFPTRSVRSF